MNRLFSLLAVLFISTAMISFDAEAKRFGGGKSFGKSFPSFSRQAAPSRPVGPQRQAAGNQAGKSGVAGKTSGASRWLGPLAGLAAGGLLASMLFGDAFEGLQIMDFLMIALLVFGGMKLFRAMRGGQAVARGRPAYAGGQAGPQGGHQGAADPFRRQAEPAFDDADFGKPGGQSPAGLGSAGTVGNDIPAWFDAAGFAEGAKSHFIRLQASWDAADMEDIRTYVTPDLFAQLEKEREAMGSASQETEVITLNSELMAMQRDGDHLVASVLFSGLVREEASAPAKEVNEIWHVIHSAASPDGDWLIAGIEQAKA